ncbi:uncharacterized protein LOC116938715 isoform X2 [Petromyzon marinus]|uniref:uncharacterized protein LOC116938715 isoform X2 n=1 Tax=Petromyzon marinus TaxID=7757 RepID=UPI003F6E6A12
MRYRRKQPNEPSHRHSAISVGDEPVGRGGGVMRGSKGHTKFCFVCLLTTLLFHGHCCNEDHGHSHDHHGVSPDSAQQYEDDNGHGHALHTRDDPRDANPPDAQPASDGGDGNRGDPHHDYQISEEPYPSGNTRQKPSVNPVAAAKQKYYLQLLFLRYGSDKGLTFQGLEKLLVSLGLGVVRFPEAGFRAAHTSSHSNSHDGGHAHVHARGKQEEQGDHGHGKGHGQEHTSSNVHEQQNENDQAVAYKHTHEEVHALEQDPTPEHKRPQDHNHGVGHDHIHEQNHDHTHDHDVAHNHDKSRHGHNQATGNNSVPEHSIGSTKTPITQHLHVHVHARVENDGLTESRYVHARTDASPLNGTSSQPSSRGGGQSHMVSRQFVPHKPTSSNGTEMLVSQTEIPRAAQRLMQKSPKPSRRRIKQHIGKSQTSTAGTAAAATQESPSSTKQIEQWLERVQRHLGRDADNHHDIGDHNALELHAMAEKGHVHDECLNASQLFQNFGLDVDSAVINTELFSYLCPAILYQIDSQACLKHPEPPNKIDLPLSTDSNMPDASAWGWGFLSITIISMLSLLGVAIVPMMNQVFFKYLLTFLVALAVGTLSGDALLHLLPHSQNSHSHNGHDDHDHILDSDEHLDGIWKGLTGLGGIYLMFIVEHLLALFKHYKPDKNKKKKKGRKVKDAEKCVGRKLSNHNLSGNTELELISVKQHNNHHHHYSCDVNGAATHASKSHEDHHNHSVPPEEEAMICHGSHDDEDDHYHDEQPQKQPVGAQADGKQVGGYDMSDGEAATPTMTTSASGVSDKSSNHHHHHHHHLHHHHSHGHCTGEEEAVEDVRDAGVSSIAWMVILGDGVHNFSDGLAIGAAFSDSTSVGLSTSIAVFCHELPHELGDFAVLLKAGMSVKQAIVYNLLSALLGYLGLVIGTAVGQYTHSVTTWIFAATAGIFLYVALVDMLPEMLHCEVDSHSYGRLGCFLLQNLGLLMGFGIMLVIARYEEHIKIDLGP